LFIEADGSLCAPAGRGIFFTTYETNPMFVCSTECTLNDLNRVVLDEDESGINIVTTIQHEDGSNVIIINEKVFSIDGEYTNTTTLTNRAD